MVGFLSQQSSKTKSVNEDIQGHTLVLFYLMYSKLRCHFLNRNSIKRIHILAKTMSNICIKIANSYKQDMFQRGRLYQTCKLSYMPLKDATWQNWKQRWYQGSNSRSKELPSFCLQIGPGFTSTSPQRDTTRLIRDEVFKSGPSKICGRQPLKNLKRIMVCLSINI